MDREIFEAYGLGDEFDKLSEDDNKGKASEPEDEDDDIGEIEDVDDDVEDSSDENEDIDGVDNEDGDEEDSDNDGDGNVGRDFEKDARYASARRAAEKEKALAIESLKKENAAEIDKLISGMGLKNPLTGELIKTKADYDTYKASIEGKRIEERLRGGKLSKEEYDKAVSDGINEHPDMKKAREIIEQGKRYEINRRISAEFDEIKAANPDIKTFEDIKKLDRYDVISRMISAGAPLNAAYFYAYRDVPSKAALEEAKNAKLEAESAKGTLRKEMSKAHLSKSVSRGSGAPSVPNDIKQSFRDLIPGISDDEIASYYAKHAGGNN